MQTEAQEKFADQGHEQALQALAQLELYSAQQTHVSTAFQEHLGRVKSLTLMKRGLEKAQAPQGKMPDFFRRDVTIA